MECSIVSPGRTRCTQCGDLTLINGECRRCEDPRCDDCSGNARVCKACKDRAHRVNNATGRCEDPSWPTPCRQSSGGAGRRGSCGTPTPQRPKTVQAQRLVVMPTPASLAALAQVWRCAMLHEFSTVL